MAERTTTRFSDFTSPRKVDDLAAMNGDTCGGCHPKRIAVGLCSTRLFGRTVIRRSEWSAISHDGAEAPREAPRLRAGQRSLEECCTPVGLVVVVEFRWTAECRLLPSASTTDEPPPLVGALVRPELVTGDQLAFVRRPDRVVVAVEWNAFSLPMPVMPCPLTMAVKPLPSARTL